MTEQRGRLDTPVGQYGPTNQSPNQQLNQPRSTQNMINRQYNQPNMQNTMSRTNNPVINIEQNSNLNINEQNKQDSVTVKITDDDNTRKHAYKQNIQTNTWQRIPYGVKQETTEEIQEISYDKLMRQNLGSWEQFHTKLFFYLEGIFTGFCTMHLCIIFGISIDKLFVEFYSPISITIAMLFHTLSMMTLVISGYMLVKQKLIITHLFKSKLFNKELQKEKSEYQQSTKIILTCHILIMMVTLINAPTHQLLQYDQQLYDKTNKTHYSIATAKKYKVQIALLKYLEILRLLLLLASYYYSVIKRIKNEEQYRRREDQQLEDEEQEEHVHIETAVHSKRNLYQMKNPY